MTLDPQARVYLDKLDSLNLPGFHTMPPDEARKLFRAMRGLAGKPDPIGSVRDEVVPDGIPIRIYRPLDASEGPLPALLYFHGGGWVLGDLETVDNLCRRLANASGCVVVSVDYRLSPEHKFPEPLLDCWMALAWLNLKAEEFGIDANRIAVGGDSAGGNLAAAVALKTRSVEADRTASNLSEDLAEGEIPATSIRPIAFQLLIYPITNHGFDTASYRENAEGYGLSRDMMGWYWNQYLARSEDGQDPLASPLLEPDLSRLPPALVITAGYDVLRDEGSAFAKRLQEAGVAVELRHFPGMIHGFLQMADSFDEGRLAIHAAGQALRRALRE